MRKLIAILMLLSLVSSQALAAVKSGTFGTPNSSETYPLEVNSDRTLSVATDAGFLMSYEAATTNDTLTVADCGKTFVVSPVTQTTFILPSAASVPGCINRFIAADGAASKTIIIDVASTDKFRGVVNSAAADTFAKGDSIISPGNTGDMVAMISSGGTVWDIMAIRGTFSDNN